MTSVTLTLDIAILTFFIGLSLTVFGKIYSRKHAKQLKAEQSLETMERAVPLILSRIVEAVGNYNFVSLLYTVAKGEKNILARWLRKIIAIYRSNPTMTLDALLRKAIMDNFSMSALLMMFYSVLEMVKQMGDEARPVVESLANLSHTVITHSDKIKKSLKDSASMLNLISTLLLPIGSGMAVVFFGGINSILFKIAGGIGGLAGTTGLGSTGGLSSLGLKPLTFPMEYMTIIFALHVFVTAVSMAYLKIQLTGKYYARATAIVEMLKQAGVSLMIYSVAVYVMVNLFSLMFTV